MALRPTTAAIWSQLGTDLRNFIRRRVPDDHVADDLLQEAFLRIHSKSETLTDTDRLVAWVYQITRNVVRDYYRRQVEVVSLPPEVPDAGEDHSTVLRHSSK